MSSDETLGRGVFSSKQARQAKNGIVPRRVFLERHGEVSISVDRLDFAELEEMAALGDKAAVGRSVGRKVTLRTDVKVFCNSGPLMALGKIGALDILFRLFGEGEKND